MADIPIAIWSLMLRAICMARRSAVVYPTCESGCGVVLKSASEKRHPLCSLGRNPKLSCLSRCSAIFVGQFPASQGLQELEGELMGDYGRHRETQSAAISSDWCSLWHCSLFLLDLSWARTIKSFTPFTLAATGPLQFRPNPRRAWKLLWNGVGRRSARRGHSFQNHAAWLSWILSTLYSFTGGADGGSADTPE